MPHAFSIFLDFKLSLCSAFFWVIHQHLYFKCQSFRTVACPGIFFDGGSTNSVEDRRQREWVSGDNSPLVWGSTQQMSETRILIRLLRMYFPQNWKFSSALSKLRNFGVGGFEHPKPPLGMPLFQNTLSVPSSEAGRYEEKSVPQHWHLTGAGESPRIKHTTVFISIIFTPI
jgi:hypothetical protein